MSRRANRGAAYFEALGRSHQARCIPWVSSRVVNWPEFARRAYNAGRFKEATRKIHLPE